MLKFVDPVYGYKFDVTLNTPSGVNMTEILKGFIQIPVLSEATLIVHRILKQMLVSNNLNEKYRGGVGSCALMTAVASFVGSDDLVKSGKFRKELHTDLLLKRALRYFAWDFKVVTECLTLFGPINKQNAFPGTLHKVLCVQDPTDSKKNMGAGSYNWHLIVEVARKALGKINQACEEGGDVHRGSILGMLFNVDPANTKIRMERMEKFEEMS